MKVLKYLFLIIILFCFSCMSMVKDYMLDMYHPAAFSPDNQYLACVSRHNILIFRTEDWSLAKKLKHHRDMVHHVAFSPQGNLLVSSGWDSKLVFWDTKTWNVVQEHKGVGKGNISFSPDGAYFALDKYKAILPGDDAYPARIFSMYPLLSMKKIFSEAGYQQIVFSPTENAFFSMDDDGFLRKYSLPDFKLKGKFYLEDSKWFNIRFLNTDEVLLQYTTGPFSLTHSFLIFNVKKGRIVSRINTDDLDLSSKYYIYFIHVFENDKILIPCSDKLIIYSISEKRIIKKIETEDKIYVGAANNKYIVLSTYNFSGSYKVLVYQLDTLKFVKELKM